VLVESEWTMPGPERSPGSDTTGEEGAGEDVCMKTLESSEDGNVLS
jgi:hypothetical protein